MNPEFVNENLEAPGSSTTIENPEAVKLWGDVTDWHHAIGTGPFILTDFVAGSSISMVKNPNYYQNDERYPQNKLPYLDKFRTLIIPDDATAVAAMRTGKIDLMDSMPLATAQQVQKSNPKIVQVSVPLGNGLTIDPRNDKAPFSDIKVRTALQMAINLPELAATYYGGTCSSDPLSLTSQYLTGWGYPYSEWPQSLKDEYAYNPTKAKKLLADAGFPTGFKTNIYTDSQVDLNLVQIIKSYFMAVGVDMEIRPLDGASFGAFVNTGRKQDAMVMRNNGALGLGFYPLRHLLRYGTGQPANASMVAGFDHYYNDALAATTVDQVKEIIKAANMDVAQNHYGISLLQPMTFCLVQPWLKGFNGQYGSMAGTQGPFFLFFYEARFWVDSSMKKSMGF
jgi:peptide/nickel transport system substrate-binding protein